MPEKSKEFLAGLAKMDEAATQAEKEFNELPWRADRTDILEAAKWMKKWVPKAGWKRLGRIFVSILNEDWKEVMT